MIDYMEDFYARVAEYDALVIDTDDLIEQDMNMCKTCILSGGGFNYESYG